LRVENEAAKTITVRRHDAENFPHQTVQAKEIHQAQKVENGAAVKSPRFHPFLCQVHNPELICSRG
jgi:hypothetical protein